MSVSHHSLMFFLMLMIGCYYYCCFSLSEALFSIKKNTTRHTQEEYLLRKRIAVLKLKNNVKVIPEQQDPEVYMNAVSNKYFIQFHFRFPISAPKKSIVLLTYLLFFIPEIFGDPH